METNAKKDFSKIGLLLLLGSLIIMVVQSVFDLIAQKVPVTMAGEKKSMKLHHILVAFAIGYAGTYACNLIGTLITGIIGGLKGSEVDNVVLNITSSVSPLTTIFITVACAPIMEELMFRKMLIDRTYKYGEGMSIVFSGLVFGLFHGNLNQFVYAFFLGIFFGFIYVKTKNIVYPIILHMITNFLGAFAGTFIIEKSRLLEFAAELEALSTDSALIDEAAMMSLVSEYAGGILLFFGYALCLFIFVIVGVILFFVNKKKFTLAPAEVPIEKGKRFSTMILNIGMILYCIFWIGNIVLQLLV